MFWNFFMLKRFQEITDKLIDAINDHYGDIPIDAGLEFAERS